MKKENVNRYALIVCAAESDVDVARRLAEPLVEAGDPDVHWYLGYLCQCGLSGTHDKSEARRWFQKAAALGAALGKSALVALDALPTDQRDGGSFVVDARGVTHIGDGWPDPVPDLRDGFSPCSPKDCERMYQWYLAAANEGDPKMQLLIGMLYEHGIHVRLNPQTALSWYNRAYKGGLHEAKVWCSRLELQSAYQDDIHKWYEERSELIDRLIEALRSRLGPAPTGDEAAFQWYLKLGEGGDPDAQIEVSRRFDLGKGVKTDRLLAYVWESIASERHPNEIVGRLLQRRLESRRVHMPERELARARRIASEYQSKWSKSGHVRAQNVA